MSKQVRLWFFVLCELANVVKTSIQERKSNSSGTSYLCCKEDSNSRSVLLAVSSVVLSRGIIRDGPWRLEPPGRVYVPRSQIDSSVSYPPYFPSDGAERIWIVNGGLSTVPVQNYDSKYPLMYNLNIFICRTSLRLPLTYLSVGTTKNYTCVWV